MTFLKQFFPEESCIFGRVAYWVKALYKNQRVWSSNPFCCLAGLRNLTSLRGSR